MVRITGTVMAEQKYDSGAESRNFHGTVEAEAIHVGAKPKMSFAVQSEDVVVKP